MLGLSKPKKKVSQVKVLLVDDEPDLVSTVQCRLKYCHCDVVTASNGKEGLEKAAEHKPDIILLDTNMPVMNGHETLEHLRKDPDLKDIPVIMFTALAEPQDVAKASAYGVADYITKPFDFSDVRDRIAKVLGPDRLA